MRISKKELDTILVNAKKFYGGQAISNTVPVLNHVKFGSDGKAILTDGEFTIIVELENCDIDCLVGIDILRNLPKCEYVDITENSGGVIVEAKNMKFEAMNTCTIDEYFEIPEYGIKGELLSDRDILSIDRAKRLVSNDELRPNLGFVFIGNNHIAATNANILCFFDKDIKLNENLLLSPKLATFAVSSKEKIFIHQIKLERDRVCVCLKSGIVTVWQIFDNLKFPNYEAVIPDGDLIEIKVLKENLMEAVSLFSYNDGKVKVDIKDNEMTIHQKVEMMGGGLADKSIVYKIRTDYKGEIKLGFSLKLFKQLMYKEDSELLTLKLVNRNLTSYNSIIVINDYLGLMPISRKG